VSELRGPEQAPSLWPLSAYGHTAFVVEGKASGISVQGQRGDTARLRRDIEDAVEDAWRQGSRARDFLLRTGDSVFTDEHGVEILRIPWGQVHEE
jgi:hypothetical protein